MFIQEIKKMDQLDISFGLFSIQNTAVHIHDAYEIIFVLRGTVDLKCTIFNYSLSEGDIFIINVKELHSFSKGSEDNLILRLHLDPYEYLNIFPRLDFYLFVCDSFASKKKDDPKLIHLQQLILRIFFLTADSPAYSAPQVEEQILSLITSLINNFQSFYLKKKGYYNSNLLRGDHFQSERVSEIQEYIYKNANEKISLEDLAEYLHLSKYYVSHLIKNTIGLSMTDFLSLTRVEQSESLLLTTSMSIEQIALECGFSAKRYYEKHFHRWFDMSPAEYRHKFSGDIEQVFTEYDFSVVQDPSIRNILKKYLVHEVSGKTAQNNTYFFDMAHGAKASVPFVHTWEESLVISDTIGCINTFPPKLLEKTKEEIRFRTVKLFQLFLNANSNQSSCMLSNYNLQMFFDFLSKLNVNIEIHISLSQLDFQLLSDKLENFLLFFKHRYGTHVVKDWQLVIQDSPKAYTQTKKFSGLLKKLETLATSIIPGIKVIPYQFVERKNIYAYNSMFLVPHIISQALEGSLHDYESYRELYDPVDFENAAANPSAYNGMFAEFHEKKPIYYVWQFLSMLGDELVHKEDGLVITKQGEDYIILIYDYLNMSSSFNAKNKKASTNITLEMNNVSKSYTVTKLYLDSENSLFHHRASMNFPRAFSQKEVEMMNHATSPKASFSCIEKKHLNHMFSMHLNPHSAVLIILKETPEKNGADEYGK